MGTYPSPVENLDGKTTYVVQAHKFGDYLGQVSLEFDDEDNLINLVGDPILLDQHIPTNDAVQAKVLRWRETFQAKASQVIGTFSQTAEKEDCWAGECRIANLILTAALEYAQGIDKDVSISLFNARGIRSALYAGPVTVSDIVRVLPFENSLAIARLSGYEVWTLVADAVAMKSATQGGKPLLSRPHFAGLKYTYSVVAEDERTVLHSVSIKNAETGVYEPVDRSNIQYKIATTGFLLGGGDNIVSPAFFPVEVTDVPGCGWDDVLEWFFRKHKDVEVKLEGLYEKV